MQELIAASASLLILTLFISQFTANTRLFIEAVRCERTVSSYYEREYEEEEVPVKLKEMEEELSRIPGVSADLGEGGIKIEISGAIGPKKALGISDDTIVIEKDLNLRVKEKENEEPDNGSGSHDPHGNAQQIPDGY